MNIVICDDDDIYRKKLENMITGILIEKDIQSEIVISSKGKQEVLEYVDSNSEVTLYFLDIELEDEYSGFELSKYIRKSDILSPIIFITNYNDMLTSTFDFKIKLLDFIHKEDDETTKQKIEECLLLISERQGRGYTNCLNIKNSKMNFSIPFENIYYLETVSGTHKIILHHKTGIVQFYDSIKHLLSILNADFVRCHKSVIVNKLHIIGKDKRRKSLLLTDGTECPYSPLLFKI